MMFVNKYVRVGFPGLGVWDSKSAPGFVLVYIAPLHLNTCITLQAMLSITDLLEGGPKQHLRKQTKCPLTQEGCSST